MNLLDVTKRFESEDDALAFLEQMRWPNGVRCPICGCDRVSRITRKSPSKNKRTRIYQCLEPSCKQQFSATNGTIFNDSHLPLTTWFAAIALIVDAKKGMSAVQLQQHLGIGSYKTAWYLCHRIRKAMTDEFPTKLSGIVEIDETYIGGKAKRRRSKKTRAELMAKKDMVIGMRERGGRVRFFHVPDAKKETIKPLLDRHVAVETKRIVTDSAAVYPFAMDKVFKNKHRTVNHSTEWLRTEDIDVHTNTIESAFSLLKRGIVGSFHRVSLKHLHRYLSEFEYRFNARMLPERFTPTLARMAQTPLMPFRELVAKS